MTPALAALISRVEAGETDRDISTAIARLLGWRVYETDPDWHLVPSFDGVGEALRPILDFTRSLDAQEALPGRIISVWFEPVATTLVPAKTDMFCAEVEGGVQFNGCAPTEAGARLAAKLRRMTQP